MSSAHDFPSDKRIREKMEVLIKKVDLETMKTKEFIQLLAKKLKVPSLSNKKAFIKKNLTEILDAMDNDNDDNDSEDENKSSVSHIVNDENEGNDGKDKKKKANPFNSPKELSKELATFLGKGSHVSRPQVVKHIWEYIKEHDLQNPDNKREILLDEKMQNVFGVQSFTSFSMAKYLSAHIHPFKPVDLNAPSTSKKRKKTANKNSKNGGSKRKRSTPVLRRFPIFKLSKGMTEITGSRELTRQKVTKAIFQYVKEHSLQNPENKREIICDDRLKRVMGGNETLSFGTIQKLISDHLIEKVGVESAGSEDVEKKSKSAEGDSDNGGSSDEGDTKHDDEDDEDDDEDDEDDESI